VKRKRGWHGEFREEHPRSRSADRVGGSAYRGEGCGKTRLVVVGGKQAWFCDRRRVGEGFSPGSTRRHGQGMGYISW